MTQQDLEAQSGRFLKVGSQHLSWAGCERTAEAQPTSRALLVEAHSRRRQAEAELMKLGPPLEEALKEAGEDTTTLLRFLHRIDSGGGPEAASLLWEDLKVQLQQANGGFHERQGGPSPEDQQKPPGGLLSHPQLAELHKLTHKQSEALRGRLARWRGSHQNGEYLDVPPSERTLKDPKYLYKPGEVQPLIQDIKRKAALEAKRRT